METAEGVDLDPQCIACATSDAKCKSYGPGQKCARCRIKKCKCVPSAAVDIGEQEGEDLRAEFERLKSNTEHYLGDFDARVMETAANIDVYADRMKQQEALIQQQEAHIQQQDSRIQQLEESNKALWEVINELKKR